MKQETETFPLFFEGSEKIPESLGVKLQVYIENLVKAAIESKANDITVRFCSAPRFNPQQFKARLYREVGGFAQECQDRTAVAEAKAKFMADSANAMADFCPHCGASFANSVGKHSCHFDLSMVDGRTKLCHEREARRKLQVGLDGLTHLLDQEREDRQKAEAEVERLQELNVKAAKHLTMAMAIIHGFKRVIEHENEGDVACPQLDQLEKDLGMSGKPKVKVMVTETFEEDEE